jgi:hypothetical protein
MATVSRWSATLQCVIDLPAQPIARRARIGNPAANRRAPACRPDRALGANPDDQKRHRKTRDQGAPDHHCEC